MHISKEHRKAVYETLFGDGVLVASKDQFAPKHIYIDKVSNLSVMILMRSLKSRKFITEEFLWNHYYWTLTNNGIAFLRKELLLPAICVPQTLKKPEKAAKVEAATGKEDMGQEIKA